MRISDFDLYSDLLEREGGFHLTAEEMFLVDARLTPVARKWGYVNMQSLAIALRALPDPELVHDIAEAMCNTDTAFFRDETPFTELEQTALPALTDARRRKKKLRLWSCGTATGQEAWSLALTLSDRLPGLVPNPAQWDIHIWATDLSRDSLAYAANASYAQFEVQRGLPIAKIMQYMAQNDKRWRFKDDIRRLVQFEEFNIRRDNIAAQGPFDVIFLRHVMDHFREDTKIRLLGEFAEALAPDGFLFLGPAEHEAALQAGLLPVPGHDSLHVRGETEQNGERAARP